ncbi:BolA/IbaG family iron-sulfur metabolism protein [Bradyrhizobium sp. CCGUVB14]|uniref:BolA/IbaG family iron-sulfur metabolism protein n=1 Tax=unclassified Bradyrhizobium TaxID=2631580 RepID=UPI0035BFA017
MVMAGLAIEALIGEALPEANVIVTDLAGTGHHCGARIVSQALAGKSRIQQHRMIHAALGSKTIDTFRRARARNPRAETSHLQGNIMSDLPEQCTKNFNCGGDIKPSSNGPIVMRPYVKAESRGHCDIALR